MFAHRAGGRTGSCLTPPPTPALTGEWDEMGSGDPAACMAKPRHEGVDGGSLGLSSSGVVRVEGKEVAIRLLWMEVPLGRVKEDPSWGCGRELERKGLI